MLKLYSYFVDCGREGELQGLFVADDENVQNLVGKELYFGSVLGKYSEISGTFELDDVTVESEDQEKIGWLIETFEGHTISGYNPFEYVGEEEEIEDEDEQEESI